jgi:crossover junction endodeoxyribonuclease RuvC
MTHGGGPGQQVVLGIDPGLRACGWGVVLGNGARATLVECGVIRPPVKHSLPRRLFAIHEAIRAIIARHTPSELAIEDPFVGNVAPASALAIGQARAVAMLAAAQAGLEVALYPPASVKLAVSGYGQSDKSQVQAMVRALLDLPAAPEPWDAADALAVAICHLGQRRLAGLAGGAGR